MFRYMCKGKILIASPPPNPIFMEAHKSLGFKEIPNIIHYNYDGITPTPTFLLDTRWNRLETYIHNMLGRFGIQWVDTKEEPPPSMFY